MPFILIEVTMYGIWSHYCFIPSQMRNRYTYVGPLIYSEVRALGDLLNCMSHGHLIVTTGHYTSRESL